MEYTIDRLNKILYQYGMQPVDFGVKLHKIFNALDKRAGIDTKGKMVPYYGSNFGHLTPENQVGHRLKRHEEYLRVDVIAPNNFFHLGREGYAP